MVESLPLYREYATDRRRVARQRPEHVKGPSVELRPPVPTMVVRLSPNCLTRSTARASHSSQS